MAAPHFKSIEACVFDAYGTLFDVHAAAEQCRAELGDDWRALTDLWRDRQLQYSWLRSLAGEYRDFWKLTEDALDFAMASLGLNDVRLRRRLLDLYMRLDTYPEVKEVLERLRAVGMKVAILSNGSADMLNAAIENAGIGDLLDAVVSADEVRVFKPHPSIYQLGVERLGLPAERMAFQSANAWDVYGASKYGYRAVWVNRAGGVWEKLPDGPHAELPSLIGLPAIVGVAESKQMREVRFRTIVESTNVLIYSLTPSGRFAYISPNFADFTGRNAEDFLGKPFVELMHEEDRGAALALLDRVEAGADRWPAWEHRMMRADGNVGWFTSSATVIRGADGRAHEIIGVTHHVTELKKALRALADKNRELEQAQAQLIEAEKLASLGRLAAGVAHEINTPIGVIKSSGATVETAVGRLREGLGGQVDQPKSVQRSLQALEGASELIGAGAVQVTKIVEHLRSYARLDEAVLKTVDLHVGLEDTLALMAHELGDGIEVVRDFGELPRVTCYAARMNQVFMSLISNARQAMGERGRLGVTTRSLGDRVEICVSDDGDGIPEAQLSRIFDPGFTTRGVGVGAGMGLAIGKRIVADHAGDITVVSRPGEGCAVTVTIPVTPSATSGDDD